MNALNHSKFTLPLAALLQAETEYMDAMIESGGAVTDHPGESAHDEIMVTRCNTLAEVRAKLQWMTEGGTGLRGEEEGFRLLLADIDRLLSEGKR